MSASVRSKYTLAAIVGEIDEFGLLIDEGRFDEACAFFRVHLDAPTLCGLETSLQRAKLLQQIEIARLSDDNDKAFVLYSLALSLNLTGGWPNRAIPLYERQIDILTRLNDVAGLSLSLGHYAKALRQVGRFRESELTALRGLKIIRERKDFLREAVNLYWLGMGLAHRGESDLSESALQRSLRIFRTRFAAQAEGVVNAFLAQRSLWLGQNDNAIQYAERGIEIGERLENDETHADLHGAAKVLISCLRMKGDALAQMNKGDGEPILLHTLRRAREIEFVEEELPALRSLAMLERQRGDITKAREYLAQSWHLAERGDFRLYNADSYNILARIEIGVNNQEAALAAATKAYDLSICDGPPFTYRRGVVDATASFVELGAEIPDLTGDTVTVSPLLSVADIDPQDEFNEKYGS